MLKKSWLLLVILALFGALIYVIVLSDEQTRDETKVEGVEGISQGGLDMNALVNKGSDLAAAEESATMSLKSMELVQGEDGKMTWRLHTTSALMRRDDGNIEVRDPRLTYFMKPDDKELLVQAEFGDILQKENKFRFIKNVYIANEERTVAGDLLEYDGNTRIMILPHASRFSSPDLDGSAAKVLWRMDDNTIEAIGNVDVYFSPPAKKQAPAP